jgi:CelD/BcsL family acetyltransferase involved in cellulose biosynthesis
LARANAEVASYRVVAESVQAAPYVAIERTTWDAYEGGLRRKFRSELRRRRRLLENEGRLTLEVCDGTQRLDELLEEGFRVEGSGWKGAYGTSIDLQPGLHPFYTEVARWAAERGWLRLAHLRLDGRPLAFDYCLEYDKAHYLLKTGYDPAYARFSPGMIIRYLMVYRAFSEGIAIYDFCGPDFAWKREWTNTTQERQFLHMFAPTALGSLDRAIFTHVNPALKRAKRSSFGNLLKRGRGLVRGRLSA